MRATLSFLTATFRHFNQLIFQNQLPLPIMRISEARTYMGQFKWVRKKEGYESNNILYLTMSRRYDLPIETLEDVVIHEMIHLMIHIKNIKDTSSHGNVFKRYMHAINKDYGRHIRVSHRCTPEELESDTKKSHSLMCLCRLTDGRRMICRASKSRVFDIHKAFQSWELIEDEEWYLVYDCRLNCFPRVRVPKLFSADDETVSLIESGVRLEFSVESGGRTILRAAAPTRR